MSVIVGPALWQLANRFSLGEPALDGGGNTICKSGGGTIWIVAPASSEVSRSWYSRNDAVTTATNCTSATGWFVPNVSQLQNPGFGCRTYWDSYSSAHYWSSTCLTSSSSFRVSFVDGSADHHTNSITKCVRAFRCVIY